MDKNTITYAMVKQLGAAHTLATSYGDIELDDEMRAAVHAALRPILESRLLEIEGANHG